MTAKVTAAIYWQALKLRLEAGAVSSPSQARQNGRGGGTGMNDTIDPRALEVKGGSSAKSGFVESFARKLVFERLAALPQGAVTVIDGETAHRFGRPGELHATLRVHEPSMYADIAFGGSLGAAEAYIQGRWSCDDLTALCRIFARNLDQADALEHGWARAVAPLAQAFPSVYGATPSAAARETSERTTI